MLAQHLAPLCLSTASQRHLHVYKPFFMCLRGFRLKSLTDRSKVYFCFCFFQILSMVLDAHYSGCYFAEITCGSSADCCYFSWMCLLNAFLSTSFPPPCTIYGSNLGFGRLMGANIFRGNSGTLCNLFTKISLSNFHNFAK